MEIIVRTGTAEAPLHHIAVDMIDAPALTGSAKQIAWANDIRQKLVRDMLVKMLGDVKLPDGRWIKNLSFFDEKIAHIVAQLNDAIVAQKVVDAVASKTAASWWIEKRDCGYGMLIVDLAPPQGAR